MNFNIVMGFICLAIGVFSDGPLSGLNFFFGVVNLLIGLVRETAR